VIVPLPAWLRSYLSEPRVPDPPARSRRDWLLVGVVSLAAVLETTLRTDEGWVAVSPLWRWGGLFVFFLSVPPALLLRRTRPLFATIWGFAPTLTYGAVVAVLAGTFGGIITTAVVLITVYALYRWGSGRDGVIGAAVVVGAGLFGNLAEPEPTIGDWIGGFIVLAIPVLVGLTVRYRVATRERLVTEVRSREREELARELHDTVAHHVSAIAVQAQAGRAVAATDPRRALDVLAVIEDAASRTLAEMRTMVGALRDGFDAELAPQQGVSDLTRLAQLVPDDLRVDVEVDEGVGALGPAVDAAVYRIARESVTNAVRHARRATRIQIRVEPAGDLVRVTIADDGTHPEGARGVGFGLVGMAERAHLLGGHCTAGPDPTGRGWRVEAALPRQAVVS
jgi:signal transduction histidine kinase